MASDTAPAVASDDPTTGVGAAAPKPGSDTERRTGAFASLFAPVEPARPDPVPAAEVGSDAIGGMAALDSSSFHPDKEDTAPGSTTTAGKAPQGVMRAFLLATAERWKKGAGAHVKRLDVEKARAAAHQVKETRQVTVNRSGGTGRLFGGGSGSGGSGGGKSLTSKSGAGTPGGSKNSPGGSRGPSGKNSSHGPKTGKQPAGSSSSGTGSTKAPAGPSGSTSSKDKNTPSGGTSSKNTPASKDTSGKGKARLEKGLSGRDGKDATGKTNGGTPRHDSGRKDSNGNTAGSKGDGKSKPADANTSGSGTAKDTGSDAKPAKVDLAKKTKDSKTDDKPKAKTTKAIPTQASRETGYRDGSRTARAASHVRAYGDGFKDGWADTLEDADRDKQRLDNARNDRKKQLEQPGNEDESVPPTAVPAASSADYHHDTSSQPIQVSGIDENRVYLGDGADRPHLSRGEVRSLKGFENRLRDKSKSLDVIAENTKMLVAHAQEQAAKALTTMEAARAVAGGDKLIGTLTRLHEQAQAQERAAQEVQTRAVRGAESCRVLLSNVEARYGDIYQAVVDSDLTVPAELAFYQG